MEEKYGFKKMSREEFKDYIFNLNVKRKMTSVQQHNTALPSYQNFTGKNHFEAQLSMKNYHTKRWNPPAVDIAQHFTSFPDGTIVTGRSLELSGAGIYGQNTNSIVIEHYGFFDKNRDVMTEEQKKTVIFMNAVLMIKYNLTPILHQTIKYHTWYNLSTGAYDNPNGVMNSKHKSCPGTNFFGGNSIQACEKYFIPLVKEQMDIIRGIKKTPTVITPPSVQEKIDKDCWQYTTGYNAIIELAQKKLINSPKQWIDSDLKNGIVPLWLIFELVNNLTD